MCTYTFLTWSFALIPHRTSSLLLSTIILAHPQHPPSIAPLTIVCAIRARNQLFVRPLERKPCLQIMFLCRRQVQRSRNNANHTIPQTQALVKRLAIRDHRIEHFPALLRIRNHKLLDLFKLMYPENSPHVPSCRTGLLSETGRITSILDRQLRIRALKPFIRVISRDRLFRRSNQVLLIFRTDDLSTTYQSQLQDFHSQYSLCKVLRRIGQVGRSCSSVLYS